MQQRHVGRTLHFDLLSHEAPVLVGAKVLTFNQKPETHPRSLNLWLQGWTNFISRQGFKKNYKLYSNSTLRQAATVGHFCNFFLFHSQQNKFP